MNNQSPKFEQLLVSRWSDKYLCRLAILDHLRECLEKDNYLKATDAPKNGEGYKNLDKELMDLSIILDFYFDGRADYREARLDKFIEKMEK